MLLLEATKVTDILNTLFAGVGVLSVSISVYQFLTRDKQREEEVASLKKLAEQSIEQTKYYLLRI